MAETPASSSSYSTDPALYIYTSLTAGSSHIVTATSRLETILRANRVPFKALDIATDDKARMLWGRRAGKDEGGRMRKLPGLVQMGLVLGDLVEIEEWNEYGELKEHVKIYYDDFTIPPKNAAPPPVAMRPLNQPFPKAGVAASTTPSTAAATPSTPAAPPAPPPLPTDKDKAKIPLSAPSTSTSTAGTSTAAKAVNTAAAPIKSIAEEAAQKAKKVQLERLREKVHGKKEKDTPTTVDGKDKENSQLDAAAPTTPHKKEESPSVDVTEGISELSISGAAALQSPTTGTWRGGQSADGGAQPSLQSPTSGTWKSPPSTSGVSEHRGSVVADAPPKDTAQIEKKSAVTEQKAKETAKATK
ncbi:hypothetical protein GGR57DRAFT_215971 [Xylariaceae sp. FL1272]|nr:hypothetical protein GGR57DRAFT_215971 [Xylariaceae sp. FL1272]